MVVCCLLLFVVLLQFYVWFWLTFLKNWSFRRAEKDAFKENKNMRQFWVAHEI